VFAWGEKAAGLAAFLFKVNGVVHGQYLTPVLVLAL
tara:strand:- start:2518 stop:2625 length:108 start_codon:yes stop_codon:yes gene_type:complete